VAQFVKFLCRINSRLSIVTINPAAVQIACRSVTFIGSLTYMTTSTLHWTDGQHDWHYPRPTPWPMNALLSVRVINFESGVYTYDNITNNVTNDSLSR